MTTTAQLKDLGYRARERYDTPVHNCHAISDVLVSLYKRAGIPAELQERRIGEKRITHYVVMVPSSEITNIEPNRGPTYVDPTVDQFSLSNWHNGVTEVGLGTTNDLPEVGIYQPGCEERKVWYHRK